VLLVLGGLLILFAAESGVYAGMLFSFALDMMVGLLHLTALEKEEKTAWRSYQRTMPVGVGKVMAGKYAAVLLTVPVSVAGAVVSNLAAFAVYGTFWPEVLGLSVLAAVAVPPVFAMLSLPFYYWFGNQIAQFTSLPQAFLFFYIIKNFEDGMWTVADLTGLVGDPVSLLLLGTLGLAGLFLLSLVVSAIGYCQRK
ncbi:MAG: ABC-2 transporter permease, partial [Dysosmobacter sp.]|nr:ABC-2 transporter permease [Dysosmobacter sp.]